MPDVCSQTYLSESTLHLFGTLSKGCHANMTRVHPQIQAVRMADIVSVRQLLHGRIRSPCLMPPQTQAQSNISMFSSIARLIHLKLHDKRNFALYPLPSCAGTHEPNGDSNHARMLDAALRIACSTTKCNEAPAVVRQLLGARADAATGGNDGNTPLHLGTQLSSTPESLTKFSLCQNSSLQARDMASLTTIASPRTRAGVCDSSAMGKFAHRLFVYTVTKMFPLSFSGGYYCLRSR